MLDPDNTATGIEQWFVYFEGCRGDDVLVGTDGKDYLEGSVGNDTLIGGPGKDYISGQGYLSITGLGDEAGADADVIYAGSGDGKVWAGLDDVVYGGSGGDTLQGNEGNGTLYDKANNPDSFTQNYMQRAA